MTTIAKLSLINTALGLSAFTLYSFYQDLKNFYLLNWVHPLLRVMDSTTTTTTAMPGTTTFAPNSPHVDTSTVLSGLMQLVQFSFMLIMENKIMLLAYAFVASIMAIILIASGLVICLKTYQWAYNAKPTTHNLVNPPTKYGNNINITLWLQECDKYFAQANILKDEDKKRETLKRLDKNTQTILNRQITNKRLITYDEVTDEIKRLYGSNVEATTNTLQEFANRKQKPNETVLQYYNTLEELARKAFASNENADKHIRNQFIHGLYNENVATTLATCPADESNTLMLHRAVDAESKLNVHKKVPVLLNNINTENTDTKETSTANITNVNHVKFGEHRPTSHSPPPLTQVSQTMTTTCNACHEPGHMTQNCTNKEAYRNYFNYLIERDKQNTTQPSHHQLYVNMLKERFGDKYDPNHRRNKGPRRDSQSSHDSRHRSTSHNNDRNRSSSNTRHRSQSRDRNNNSDGRADVYPKNQKSDNRQTHTTNINTSGVSNQ